MIEIAPDAPGSFACGRGGLPLLAVCACGRRRLIPFRLLRTSEADRTPLYGRPFKCNDCGGREITLFDIESQAELDSVQHLVLQHGLRIVRQNRAADRAVVKLCLHCSACARRLVPSSITTADAGVA